MFDTLTFFVCFQWTLAFAEANFGFCKLPSIINIFIQGLNGWLEMKVFTKMVLDARWTHVISGRDSSWWIAHLANDTFATVTIWENAFSVSVWGFFLLLQVFRFCAFSWNKSTFGCICYVHKSSHSFRNGKSWKIWIWFYFLCSVFVRLWPR